MEQCKGCKSPFGSQKKKKVSKIDIIIHILTGNEVTSVRLFPRGTLSDQNRDLFPEVEGNRPFFWSLTGPRGIDVH